MFLVVSCRFPRPRSFPQKTRTVVHGRNQEHHRLASSIDGGFGVDMGVSADSIQGQHDAVQGGDAASSDQRFRPTAGPEPEQTLLATNPEDDWPEVE